MVSGPSLQPLLRPSSTSPVSQPVRNIYHPKNATDASLPHSLEQLRSLTSFKQLDEKHISSAACNGISVPVQQSLPGAERRIQADNCTIQADKHPGSAIPEDAGQAPSCKPITRSARSPADGGALIAS